MQQIFSIQYIFTLDIYYKHFIIFLIISLFSDIARYLSMFLRSKNNM